MVRTNFRDAMFVIGETEKLHKETVANIAKSIVDCYKSGGRLLVFGNGGSYADALHMAGELEGAYNDRKRPALPALAPANPAALTAIGNDFGYDKTFVRFVEANAMPGDIVIGMSTSGGSENVVMALEEARKKKSRTVLFTGSAGGKARQHADIILDIPSDYTPYIQLAHSAAYHIICDIVESELFGDVA